MFSEGADGVQLTRDNHVASLRLQASPNTRALFNDTTVNGIGTLKLAGLTAVGQVQILARDAVRSGHIIVNDLYIEQADTRESQPRPQGYGVEVLQGAITIWNQHADATIFITADLTGLSAGSKDAPVRGSGIFVSGGGDTSGRLEVSRLHTCSVFSDGGIPEGTAGQITGAIFVVYGAHVKDVTNIGPVTTYGVNDMVLDNWGTVDCWTVKAPVTSYGPSGIGFVNFGFIDQLIITALVETFGIGARGFNIYAGTINVAEFDRIETHADAAVGIQISRPFGRLIVHNGIETHGGEGDSLVKGVITRLAAVGLSLKPGSIGREIHVEGGIIAHGVMVPAIESHGRIDKITICDRGNIK